MKSLPLALRQAKNVFGQESPWLVLLTITLPAPDSTVFRIVPNNEDVEFEGLTYTAFPVEIGFPDESSKGEIPSLDLKVSNVTRIIQSHLEALNGASGTTVKLVIVNTANLTEDYSELTMDFEVLSSSYNSMWITFKCGASNPLRRRFLDKYFANHCNWQYKSVECASTSTDLTCERTITACRAKNNSTRFGGYPGLDSNGLRLV